jgi:MYXO-CTERM domain-containing protein
VAVIDAGAAAGLRDLAEQRVVTGHGSLLVAPLDRTHPLGGYVFDAGEPLDPYVLPDPPPDPTLVPEPGDAAGATVAMLAVLALKRSRRRSSSSVGVDVA